jgi:hypothetical protein
MRNGNLDKASDYVTYILYLLNLNKMSAEYIHRYPQMLTLLFIMIQQTSISERNLGEHPEDFIPVSAFPSVTAELMGLLMTTWPEYFDSARVFNNYSVMHFDKAARREAQASAKYPACQAAMLLAYDAELDLFNRRLAERLGNTQIQDCCAVDRGGTDREFKSSCALLAPVSQQLSASSYRVELSRRYDPSNSIGPCKGFLFDGALNDQLSPFAAHYSRNNTVELFHPQNRVNGMFGFGQKKFTGTGVVQEYVPGGRIAAVSPFFELRFFTLGAKEHFISVVLPNAPKQLKFNPRWAARMQNLPPEATADGPSLQRLATRARPTQSPSGVLRKQSVQASTGVSRPPPSGQRTKTPSVLGGPAPLPSTGVSRAPPSGQRTNTPSVLSKPDPELDRFLEVHATSGRRLPPPKDSNPPTHPRRTSRQTEKEYPPSRSTPRQPDPIDRRKVSRQPAPEFPRHVPAGSVRSPKPSLKPSSDEQRIVVYYKGNPNKTLTGMPIEVMQDQVLLLNSSITPGDNNYYTVEVDGDVYRWEDFMLNLFP